MNNYKNDYHIHIHPDFLFDEYKAFKSIYTPWVYLALKLKYNFYIQKQPYKTFSIDIKALSAHFATTNATIYETIKELRSSGLLIKDKNKYRIINESSYIELYSNKESNTANTKAGKFIMINHNDFEQLLRDIKLYIDPLGKYKRLIVKCLKLYYYLMNHDAHFINYKKYPIVESTLNQTMLEKKLGIEHRVIKELLKVLEDRKYIKLDSRKIYTLNPKTYDYDKYPVVESTTEPAVRKKELPKKETNGTEENKVPDVFIGYKKSDDGKIIFIIYYSIKMKCIAMTAWCQGDGVPPTMEEYDTGNELYTYGKKSKHYNPENYWLYKKDIESIKKVA